MSKENMSDDEILSRIEQEESQSYGINDSALSADRAKAFNYFTGEPFGNEIEGRSQIVSRDVLDVVESALPQLLKIFVSGDQAVKFMPRNQNDIEAAEQETDYVNHVVMEKNPGFKIFHTWFKDSLIQKNGYVKVQYEEKEETETENYQGLTDNQLTMLAQDKKVEVLEHTSYSDEIAQQQKNAAIQQIQQQLMQAQQQAQMNPQAGQQVNALSNQLKQLMAQPDPMLHDVKISITEKNGCVKIENVAPEDIMVSMDCREVSVSGARFVQHRTMMSREEMEEQGWDVPDNLGYSSDTQRWNETLARDLYDEGSTDFNSEDVLVRDTYIRINGELKRYIVAGNTIVFRDDCEIIPFATITPHIMPHRHIGMSYADMTMDVQLIKSVLLRGQVDSMFLANSPRFAISDRVNLEDMLTSRPGGIVRTQGEPGTSIIPLNSSPPSPMSFQMVEYMDSIKEKRTGVTAYNQGLDADSLNKTATGISIIQNAAAARLELVARSFAETGVKELFMLVHRLVRKHYTKPDVIRLRDKWVDVDPRQWKTRTDMSIAVGLGTGNKDQQLAHLSNIFQMQTALLQAGVPVIQPDNVHETLRQIAINAGFKQPEMFVTDPKTMPPQQPQQNPLLQVEQMKLQAKQQEMQVQAQMDQQKAQAQLQQEQLRSQNDVAIEQAKIQAQMELERWKAQLEAETALKKAQMETEAKIAIEQFKANQDAVMALNQHKAELGGLVEKAKGAQGNDQLMAVMQGISAIAESLNRPKMIIRDETGRAAGVA